MIVKEAPLPPTWEQLATFSASLLKQRRVSYHEEDDRIRVMAAIVEAWRRVVADEDVPYLGAADLLGAYWEEMLLDLDTVAVRAKDRDDRARERGDLTPPEKHAAGRTATLAAALRHYHQPYDGTRWGIPRIVFCHRFNQEMRRGREIERMAAA